MLIFHTYFFKPHYKKMLYTFVFRVFGTCNLLSGINFIKLHQGFIYFLWHVNRKRNDVNFSNEYFFVHNHQMLGIKIWKSFILTHTQIHILCGWHKYLGLIFNSKQFELWHLKRYQHNMKTGVTDFISKICRFYHVP